MARHRPAPEGWDDFGFWLRCSSVTERRLCSFVAPRQKPKSSPAKPEVIFEQTLSPAEQTQTKALARLCRAYNYEDPEHLPREQWKEFQVKVDVSDYAAKEQGIGPEIIYLLHPCAQAVHKQPTLL